MKINKEIKMVKQEVTTYIAEDGQVFSTEFDCLKHEEELEKKRRIEEAEKLRIEKLDNMIPINYDGLPNDNNCFNWYKLNTKEDFETLIEAYRNGNLEEPENFPTLYCVETCGYEPYEDESYSYDLVTCKTCTEKFWETLGYKVVLTKKY